MYQVNSKYKNVIYNPDTKHDLRILVDGVPIDTKYCRNIHLDDETFDTDNFTLGSACYSQIKLDIDKEAFNNLSTYKEFYFEEIIKLDDDEEQIIPIGFFIHTQMILTLKMIITSSLFYLIKCMILIQKQLILVTKLKVGILLD